MPEIFRQGVLEMPSEPVAMAVAAPLWRDCPTNRVAVVVAVLLAFLLVSEYLRLLPTIWDCFVRWRAGVSLEHSVSWARSRNTMALASALPFLLLADRYRLFHPAFWESVPAALSLPATAIVLFAFAFLRHCLHVAIRPALHGDMLTASRKTMHNGFILLTALWLLTALPLSVFSLADGHIRMVLLLEAALVWLVFLVRTGQIFAERCNSFTTILYLCAFELLPVVILLFTGTR